MNLYLTNEYIFIFHMIVMMKTNIQKLTLFIKLQKCRWKLIIIIGFLLLNLHLLHSIINPAVYVTEKATICHVIENIVHNTTLNLTIYQNQDKENRTFRNLKRKLKYSK